MCCKSGGTGHLDWGDELDVRINSVIRKKDQAQRGRELLAFFDSDKVLPKTLRNENTLEKTTRSRSGIGFKGAKGSHIKHHGQWRFCQSECWKYHEPLKESRGCAQAVDLCKSPAREEAPPFTEGSMQGWFILKLLSDAAVCLPCRCESRFSSVGLVLNRDKEGKIVRPQK